MTDNKNFFPTPRNLLKKMFTKLQNRDYQTILEPSAGKGDIVEYFKENHYHRQPDFSCIELDNELRANLVGKGYNVIDSDFLTYSGQDSFDVIVGNPPFDNGELHLLKAINIIYSGQIVFLLNAETLKNPYTNTRKELVRKLEKLNADVEYIQNAFQSAERKTDVEVALVYINIERDLKEDLFVGCKNIDQDETIDVDEKDKLTYKNSIEFLVKRFNASVQHSMNVVKDFYSMHPHVDKFLTIKVIGREKGYSSDNFQEEVNETVNGLLKTIRKSYWQEVLELKEVKSRMTAKIRDEFYKQIEAQEKMDFTENNIRTFILNLIGDYENILNTAVDEIFERFTQKHHWSEEFSKNIHYFDGWKTNKAFYCNHKVIIPVRSSYSEPFLDYSGNWKLDYEAKRYLHDIDVVMNYFDGKSDYQSISEAIDYAFEYGESRNIESTYFTINVYKKGTMHLTFKDENIRRRFNIIACKFRNWLGTDYGKKSYTDMTEDEKKVVDSFEGEETYTKNINNNGYALKNLKLLETA